MSKLTKEPRKKFGVKKVADLEPAEFELGDEVYVGKGGVPGLVLIEFLAKIAQEENSIDAYLPFFDIVLPEGEATRLMKQLRDENNIVDLATIGEIFGYLVEHYSGRPTEEPAL